MARSEIKLGSEYQDIISGFVGIAVAKTEWLNGCVRVTLSPKLDKDGKFQDNICLDVEQLKETGTSINIISKETGGERDDKLATSRDAPTVVSGSLPLRRFA